MRVPREGDRVMAQTYRGYGISAPAVVLRSERAEDAVHYDLLVRFADGREVWAMAEHCESIGDADA